jgi:hypothetical protein
MRRPCSQVSVIGQFLSPAPGPLRKVTLRQGLDTPGDSLAKKLLVVGAGLFPKDLDVLVPEFSDGHPGGHLDLLIRCCFHPKPPWFMGFAPQAARPHRNLRALTRE